MTDLPILFSAPMVLALMREIDANGTGKTQTRRALNQKLFDDSPGLRVVPFGGPRDFLMGALAHAGQGDRLKVRYGPGDRLYVREHWRAEAVYDETPPRDIEHDACNVLYEADGKWSDVDQMNSAGKFRQAMHMPRWASRITLLVTDVRVERLQDCSEADAKAEGITGAGLIWGLGVDPPDPARAASPVEAYARLWDLINGPGAWAANPWVAAYTFKPVIGNIDRLPNEVA
jgi:hypothetical protein